MGTPINPLHWWLVTCMQTTTKGTFHKEGYTTTPGKAIRPRDIQQWKASIGMPKAVTTSLCYMGYMTVEEFMDGADEVRIIPNEVEEPAKPNLQVVPNGENR